MKQERRLVDNSEGTILVCYYLVVHMLRRAVLRSLDFLSDEPLQLRVAPELLHNRIVAQAAVPHRHHRHIRIGVHHLAVPRGGRRRRLARRAFAEASPARRDSHTGAEPLHIPFPRCRECLVEIVKIQDQVTLGCREPPEIHQVRIAAGLHLDARCGRACQIRRLDDRRAAEKGEWRFEHARIAERD